MEKSVLGITDSVRYHKQGLTTSDLSDIEGTFVVKVSVQNIDTYFLNTKLHLNEDNNFFNKQLNGINYNKTLKKLRDASWKNSYFASIDFS